MARDFDLLGQERMFDRRLQRTEPQAWTCCSREGMVASAHYLATQAGVDVLAEGGNAFDAAIATSLALSVVESAGSGLGGMAILTASSAHGRPFVLAGPCRAPLTATPDRVGSFKRYSGYRAVATPGYPALIESVHRRFGTMPLPRLLEPAVALASHGYPCTNMQAELIERYGPKLRRHNSASLFLAAEGRPPAPAAVLRQARLAQTLEHLGRHGLRDFYEGAVAAELAADVEANDGFLRPEDLRAYEPPAPQPTISCSFRTWQIHTADAPAGGRALLHMLRIFDRLASEGFEPDSPSGVLLMARIIRRARLDRRLDQRGRSRDGLGEDEAVARALEKLGGEGETSHLSTFDRYGNAVGLTQSIERSFGAKVATPSLGFLLNGYLKTFNIVNPRHPYFLVPRKAARSNAAPTLALQGGLPFAVLGSTGSERMASSIFGVLVRLLQQHPFEAVHAPRLHATPDGQVLLESSRMQPEVRVALQQAGFHVRDLEPYSFLVGGLQLIVRRPDEVYVGVADPRRDGAAAGPAPLQDDKSEHFQTH